MARKLKHSKIKNTGILFELLTRQITADVLNNKESKSVRLIKQYFNENTQLGKELQFYQLLTEKRCYSQEKALQLIEAVVKSRKKISSSELRREKYNLIKEIKSNYSVVDFFNARISNYKVFASIYKLFQSETIDEDFHPEESIDAKFTVLEHITSKKITKQEKQSEIVELYKEKDKDLRLLTYQILVDKFNSKYKTLNESQKTLLKKYINNISNTNSLKEFISIESFSVKNQLKKELIKVEDKITKIKLTEAVNQINSLSKGNIVKDKQVLTLMRYYELVKELKNVHKN